jgi:ComF family protein
VLCEDCRRQLLRRADEPAGLPLGMPADLPWGLLQLEWCAAYSGAVRAALHALKYGGERRLAPLLGVAMAERWAQTAVGGEVITWVPVHPARRRERGFDQAEELARVMAAHLGLPLEGGLRRSRRTVAQHALGRGARARNVGGVFSVDGTARPRLRDRWVVIVDDIVTTGATLAGCADALLESGAAAVSAVAVARDR